MRQFLPSSLLVIMAFFASVTLQAQTDFYVSPSGNNSNDGLSAASPKATIQAAVDAAAVGDVINVAAGTYLENVTISKNNLKLLSLSGAAATTIKGTLSGGLGSVRVTSGVNGVTIGAIGKGFTIIGFDGTGAAEAAAVYLVGAHTDITIAGNEIVADGDEGLLCDYNAAIDRITITNNIFSGKTFLGAEPGGCGSSTQFDAKNNVPRQLVVMGGGAGVTASKNVVFTNNTVIGTAGGFNTASGCEQGNSLVTIDVIGATITGNYFNGVTTRAGSASLRTRGKTANISCNTFLSAGSTGSVAHIVLGSANPLTGATPNSLAGIAQSNAFPEGGAYLVGDNANTYVIYRNQAQATAAAALVNAGQTAIATATNLLPAITAPANLVLNAEAGLCSASTDLGTPLTTASPCSPITTVTNNAPTVFPVGVTNVTWTVTDQNGQTATATQTVTVNDVEKPRIRAGRLSRVNDPGTCGAIIQLPIPNVADNCGIASITNNAGTNFFPIGTTVVIWTVTDAHGNSDTASQKITVVDNEQPVLAAIANQVFCKNSSGNYTLPVATATDNCGISSYRYTITGATSREGEGADASGSFNTGVSTVLIVATDVNNNTHAITYTVTVVTLPTVTIAVADNTPFCNKLSVVGTASQSDVSFEWSLGGTTVSHQALLQLGLANADGNYALKGINANGCSSDVVYYQYNKQQFTGNYTILASTQANIGQGNILANGSLGVMNAAGTATFYSNSAVASTGAFVKAPRIVRNGTGINIASSILAPATVVLPAMQYNTSNTRSLPNMTVATNSSVTLNGNYANLVIRKGANAVVNGTAYGSIKLEEGAKIRFTASVIDIGELVVDKGTSIALTELRFAPNTSLRVTGKISLGANVRMNPDNQKLTCYMGDANKDEETFLVNGTNVVVVANVMIPKGNLTLTSDVKSRTPVTGSVYMTGFFFAEKVESTLNGVVWNSFDCNGNAVNNTAAFTGNQTATEDLATNDLLQVTVMPNPSASYFTLKIASRLTSPVQIRVTDASGRVVDSRSNIQVGATIQIGHQYKTGTYYTEFIQGNHRKVVQLLKVQ